MSYNFKVLIASIIFSDLIVLTGLIVASRFFSPIGHHIPPNLFYGIGIANEICIISMTVGVPSIHTIISSFGILHVILLGCTLPGMFYYIYRFIFF